MEESKIRWLYQMKEEAEVNGNYQLAKRLEEELDTLISEEADY